METDSDNLVQGGQGRSGNQVKKDSALTTIVICALIGFILIIAFVPR